MEKIISTKKVYECPILQVEEAEVQLPDGSNAKRWYVVKRDAALVICIKNGKMILRREFRSASQSYEWRFPAGGAKEGETPVEAAIRETREEIGLEPLNIQPLLSLKNNSSTIKQNTHCFVASEFRENPLDTGEPEEKLAEIKELTFEEVKTLLNTGQLSVNMAKALVEFFNKHE